MATLDPQTVKWRVGLGTIVTARFDAGAHKTYPVIPYVNFTYKEWFTLDENEARVNLFTSRSAIGAAGLRAGPTIKVDLGRGRSRDPRLSSLPKVPITLEVGGFVSYTRGPARLRLRVRQDATGGHGGVIAELDGRMGFYKSEHLSLALQAETTWASRTYMRTFYGISPAASVATGLAVFDPHTGVRTASVGLAGEYKFDSKWSLIAAVQYVRLVGEAAASSLTQYRRSVNRGNFGTFIVYTF